MKKLIIEVYRVWAGLRDLQEQSVDTTIRLRGVIDEVYSATFIQRFQDIGSFEFFCQYREDYLSFLQVGYCVIRSDSDRPYIIDSVTYSTDVSGNKLIHVSGTDFISVLNRFIQTARQTVNNSTFQTHIESAIANIFEGQTALFQFRTVDALFTTTFSTSSERFGSTAEGGTHLLDRILHLCRIHDVGVVTQRTASGERIFNLAFAPFVDKTAEVFFSTDLKNLSAWNYEDNQTDKANVAFVQGANKGVWVNYNTYYGLGRFETYVDESGTAKESLSTSEYNALLASAGQLVLNDGTQILNVESNTNIYSYPDDYDLGYIVTVKTPVVTASAKITEITEIFDSNGYAVFPTISTGESVDISSTSSGGSGANSDLIDTIYPIGSIYMSVNSTDPSNLFAGTTWQRIQDRFLLAAGSTYSAGATGGSADAVIPYHRHSVAKDSGAITGGSHSHDLHYNVVYRTTATSGGGVRNFTAGATGGTLASDSETHTHDLPAHNTNYAGESVTGKNMPPYLAVYIWKRTA